MAPFVRLVGQKERPKHDRQQQERFPATSLSDQPRLAKMESHTATEQQSGCDQSLDQCRAALQSLRELPASSSAGPQNHVSRNQSREYHSFRGEEREHTETNHILARFC